MFLRQRLVLVLLCAFSWLSASADPDVNRIQDALSRRELRMRQARTEWRVTRQLSEAGNQFTAKGSLSIDSFTQGYRLVFRDEGTGLDLPARFDFALPLETPIGYIVSVATGPSSPLAPRPKGLLVTSLDFLPPRFVGAIVLTGVNPFRLLQQQKIQVETTGDLVTVRGKLLQGIFPDDSAGDGADLVLRLDSKRDMAVVEATLRLPGRLPERAQVGQWEQWNGCWIPKSAVLTGSGAETRAEYVLEAVGPSTGISPPWEGEGISDHRLGGRVGKSVTYEFTWKLPSLTELRKMQEQQYRPATRGSEKIGW